LMGGVSYRAARETIKINLRFGGRTGGTFFQRGLPDSFPRGRAWAGFLRARGKTAGGIVKLGGWAVKRGGTGAKMISGGGGGPYASGGGGKTGGPPDRWAPGWMISSGPGITGRSGRVPNCFFGDPSGGGTFRCTGGAAWRGRGGVSNVGGPECGAIDLPGGEFPRGWVIKGCLWGLEGAKTSGGRPCLFFWGPVSWKKKTRDRGAQGGGPV